MLDRLLEVGLHGANRHTEKSSDLAVRQSINTREHQDTAPALRKLGDRTLELFDLGAVLDHAGRIWAVIGNLEQGVDLIGSEAALFSAAAIGGDVKRDAKQIRLGAPDGPDLPHAGEAEKSLVERLGCEIRRAQTAR